MCESSRPLESGLGDGSRVFIFLDERNFRFCSVSEVYLSITISTFIPQFLTIPENRFLTYLNLISRQFPPIIIMDSEPQEYKLVLIKCNV